MAVKTITIDMEAYEALRRHKRGGQSFSDVIKEHFGGKTTGAVLRRVIAELEIEESTLDEIDGLIGARADSPARAAEL